MSLKISSSSWTSLQLSFNSYQNLKYHFSDIWPRTDKLISTFIIFPIPVNTNWSNEKFTAMRLNIISGNVKNFSQWPSKVALYSIKISKKCEINIQQTFLQRHTFCRIWPKPRKLLRGLSVFSNYRRMRNIMSCNRLIFLGHLFHNPPLIWFAITVLYSSSFSGSFLSFRMWHLLIAPNYVWNHLAVLCGQFTMGVLLNIASPIERDTLNKFLVNPVGFNHP